MFGLFKRKSQKEKLSDLYRKKKELAFKVSKTNRKESDKLEKEANDILIEIDKLKEDQCKFNSMKKILILIIPLAFLFSCEKDDDHNHEPEKVVCEMCNSQCCDQVGTENCCCAGM